MTEESKGKAMKVFIREASGVVREISTFNAFVLAITLIGFTSGFEFYDFWASTFNGPNWPLAVLAGAIPCVAVAVFYWLMTVAFPRTGGDYVWVSRIIHPSIGFANSFMFFVIMVIVLLGFGGNWFTYETSTFFSLLGTWLNSAAFTQAAATILQEPWFAICATIYLLVIFVLTLNMKTLKITVTLGFILNIIATCIIASQYLPITPAIFQARFDAWANGATSYQGIINAARSAGYQYLPTSSAFFIMAAMYLFGLKFSGYTWGNYYSGEIRRVSKAIPIIFIGSLLLTAVAWSTQSALWYTRIGPEFLASAAYFNQNDPTNTMFAPLTSTPILHFFYGTFLLPPGPIGLLLSLLVILGGMWFFYWMWNFSGLLICSRQIFAWSFDRILPEKLADIDKVGPFRGPLKSMTLVIIIAIVVSRLGTSLPSLVQLSAVWGLVMLVMLLIPSIAGIIFPFTKKELFQSSPNIVKKMIGPIPVISVIGVLSFIASLFGAWQIFINPLLGGSIGWDWLLELFIAGFVIYWIAYYVRKRQGIDMSLTFKEIPPE